MPWTTIEVEKQDKFFIEDDSDKSRVISYKDALYEALDQSMARDSRVFIMGEGVDDAAGVFGTTKGLHEKYGHDRVFDTPIAENSLTGIAAGAAMTGLRPILIHSRMDFLIISLDQLVNHACKWSYMFGGKVQVPLVIRTISARGWGSGAQHSQCVQGMMMNVQGLKIAAPATPYDAKGLLISSIIDNNPVLFVEHRWLYKTMGNVPDIIYSIPFGKGAVRRKGTDITIVAVSYMVIEALKAAEKLILQNISAEVIDLRTIKPIDEDIILESLAKTGKLLIADTGSKTGGVASEISAIVAEKGVHLLKKPVVRVCCPDTPTPASDILEKAYYQDSETITGKVIDLMK
ncbi:pyruvate dehydrogenase E1 component beta subunit [Ruminiclostridium sufflavum DSM 19573]|uniref:Pyruvate dehydrogenase E1 component beta subunit n=1 Tax=Ruminiclostridium sufflavum DSM 19573 TaxID=1121337 RepID=A0A318XIQ6_9FIRM|nr:alpha-ketoacid dehydrogenase subunit beta [Ruminiclostridium sufflavum]PYG85000.1 pyruvate dehydrogenase E1 component beta subunit [Ruminiclostridium sufflavum DSM 19573]